MPEKTLKKLKERILPQWKVCFIAAVIVGFLAHFYKITNWLPNWDSLVFRYDPQNMIAIGRWFLPVVCSLSSFYDLPFLNGIIAIVFHGLSAVCICKMFDIKKSITAFLIGAVVVSFPTVTSVMMYNYVADGYSIAFFFSTLAALLLTKEKPGYILAIVLIVLSTGIYQAYVTVTVVLILMKLIDDMLHRGVSFTAMLKKAAFMLLSGILGVAIYGIVLKMILGIFSVELLEYQGANATASLANLDIFSSLYIIKETFIKCFFDMSNGINIYVALNMFVLAFTVTFYIKCIIKRKIYKKPAELICIVILTGLLVLGAGALAFINSSVDYHNLMRMGYIVFYLLFLVIYEKDCYSNEKHNTIKCWIVLVTALVMIANQIVIANVSYHKAQIAYEKSYGVLVRVADRIEQTPGAENCDKLLVIGALEGSEAYSINLTPDITGITDGYIIRKDDEIVGQSVLCDALSDYCDKDYNFVYGEEKKNIMARDDVRSMEKWPFANSVTVIDDTVIIKLGTEGEE